MAIKIIENGKVEKLTLHSSDITVLDVANKFKDKNLESVITEISDTEHLHIGEIDLEKEGVWIEDNDNLDSSESNTIIDRLKNYFNGIVGDLKTLTTNSKDTLVGAINENASSISNLSNPNLFINGDFQVWQRGTEFNTSGWNTVYTADRWGYGSEKATKVEKTDNGLKITALESGSAANIYQRLEDGVTKNLVGKKVTLTFYTKESTELCNKLWVAGIENGEKFYYADIPFNNKGVKDTFSTTIEITKFTKNIEFGFQMKTSEVGSSVELIGAKLEVGNKATPIISRNYGEELALCQRYFEKSYPDDKRIGTNSFNNVSGNNISGQLGDIYTSYIVTKRTSPTITVYSADSGVSGKVSAWSNTQNKYVDVDYEVHYTGNRLFSLFNFNKNNTVTDTIVGVKFNWTADAEIY